MAKHGIAEARLDEPAEYVCQIYYKKEPDFMEPEDPVCIWNYQFLFGLPCDLEEVFFLMQGEQWSPNGEARELIELLGLRHTSMSVGDLIHRIDYPLRENKNSEWFAVADMGFKPVKVITAASVSDQVGHC
jgi:hypothetical protein